MPRKISKTSTKETKLTLEADVYNTEGKTVSKILLPKEIFAAKSSPPLLAQAVRVYLANQRSGTVSTKSRGQVTGSTRKIYRQKGTGRARHGDIKAPIFVGGGVAHGPHPQDYSLEFPRKMKRLALFAALTEKHAEQKLIIMRGLDELTIKSKKLNQVLADVKLKVKGQKPHKILLVTGKYNKNIYLSGRNIENLTVGEAKLLNPYDILVHSRLLMMEEAVEELSNVYFKKKSLTAATVKSSDIKKTVKSRKKPSVKRSGKSPAKKI